MTIVENKTEQFKAGKEKQKRKEIRKELAMQENTSLHIMYDNQNWYLMYIIMEGITYSDGYAVTLKV